jgi:hypothetical protein
MKRSRREFLPRHDATYYAAGYFQLLGSPFSKRLGKDVVFSLAFALYPLALRERGRGEGLSTEQR